MADNDDDGENGAGGKLAQLLDAMQAQGVLIAVSRWYGGIHLGSDRFRLINNCARVLLLKVSQQQACYANNKPHSHANWHFAYGMN